jgi:RNA polymerase sigma-70 factor (ECF subfamily)
MALTSKEIDRESEELRIIQAARQDPRVFGDLYKLYVEQVFRYLYSRTENVHEAEDITAQTFLAAFESFDRFRQEDHFASWLFTIARNKAMDHFRQRKNTVSFDETAEIAVDNDPLSGVIRSEQSAVLASLIRALPEEERELLRLRFLAEMSYPEIAHLLHRNEDAVKKTIYRLLARLHSQLEVSNE